MIQFRRYRRTLFDLLYSDLHFGVWGEGRTHTVVLDDASLTAPVRDDLPCRSLLPSLALEDASDREL